MPPPSCAAFRSPRSTSTGCSSASCTRRPTAPGVATGTSCSRADARTARAPSGRSSHARSARHAGCRRLTSPRSREPSCSRTSGSSAATASSASSTGCEREVMAARRCGPAGLLVPARPDRPSAADRRPRHPVLTRNEWARIPRALAARTSTARLGRRRGQHDRPNRAAAAPQAGPSPRWRTTSAPASMRPRSYRRAPARRARAGHRRRRTAMSLEEWREGEITQAAVAWVLAASSCASSRTTASSTSRCSPGPGRAAPRRSATATSTSSAHPQHSDREYLEDVFREVAALPRGRAAVRRAAQPALAARPDGRRRRGAARDVLDRDRPGHRRARPRLHRPGPRTRASSATSTRTSPRPRKKRYALLQTPVFVEEFILDRTLDAGARRVRPRRGPADRPDLRLRPLPARRLRAAVRAVAGARAGRRTQTVLAQRRSTQIARRRPQPVRRRDRALPAAGRRAASLRHRPPGRGAGLHAEPRHRRQPAARRRSRAGCSAVLVDADRLTGASRTSTRPRTPRSCSGSSARATTPSSATRRTSR